LLLRRGRSPRLARVEQRRDRVLVAVEVARLEPDDERHGYAVGRRGRLDLVARGWVLRIVWLERPAAAVRARAGQRRALGGRALAQIEELERRRLVALLVLGPRLTRPRLDLRACEHGAADRVV